MEDRQQKRLLTYHEVIENLCFHDSRNPDNICEYPNDMVNNRCYCDNCFTGRTRLAEDILLRMEVTEITK